MLFRCVTIAPLSHVGGNDASYDEKMKEIKLN